MVLEVAEVAQQDRRREMTTKGNIGLKIFLLMVHVHARLVILLTLLKHVFDM